MEGAEYEGGKNYIKPEDLARKIEGDPEAEPSKLNEPTTNNPDLEALADEEK